MSTHIEWTDETWNPVTGCDRVSPGCDHCYALTMAKRLKGMGNPKYQTDGRPSTSGPGFAATFHDDALDIPATWRRPRLVFVNSMGDLFHDEIADFQIARVWAVMARYPQHTFQILTKRHARLRSLVSGDLYDLMVDQLDEDAHGLRWPLPNVWLGVSAENQQWADIRIPALLATPAAVRFISAEPLLGPVDLSPWLHCPDCGQNHGQCQAAGVPFLFKQWGEYAPRPIRLTQVAHMDGATLVMESRDFEATELRRVGKKAAGRVLDGRTWDQYPEPAHT